MRSLPSVTSRTDTNQVKWFAPAAITSIVSRGRPRTPAQSSIASARLWHNPTIRVAV